MENVAQPVSTTMGKAVSLYYENGEQVPKKRIYDHILSKVLLYAEKYEKAEIQVARIKVFYAPKEEISPHYEAPAEDYDDTRKLISIVEILQSDEVVGPLAPVKSLHFVQSRIPKKITALKRRYQKNCRPFMVADLETVLVNNRQVVYAGGYLIVKPGMDLTMCRINTYLSENNLPFYDNFLDRSEKMMFDFISNLEESAKKDPSLRTVYFHNFARFDGIFIVKYYVTHNRKVKTLFRNHKLYEIKVYLGESLMP